MKITFLFLCNIIALQVYCQQDLDNRNSFNIKSSIIDTVKTSKNCVTVNALWLNDTISVRVQNKNLKIDTIKYSSYFKDTTFLADKEKLPVYLEISMFGAQNCFCYALEKCFEHSNEFNQNIFNKSTHVGEEALMKVLNNYFVKVSEIITKPKKNLNTPIADDVLLAFEIKSRGVIHAVYYSNGVFYTKNGVFKPTQFKSLRKFLRKHYFDTERIIVYKINRDRIKSIVSGV